MLRILTLFTILWTFARGIDDNSPITPETSPSISNDASSFATMPEDIIRTIASFVDSPTYHSLGMACQAGQSALLKHSCPRLDSLRAVTDASDETERENEAGVFDLVQNVAKTLARMETRLFRQLGLNNFAYATIADVFQQDGPAILESQILKSIRATLGLPEVEIDAQRQDKTRWMTMQPLFGADLISQANRVIRATKHAISSTSEFRATLYRTPQAWRFLLETMLYLIFGPLRPETRLNRLQKGLLLLKDADSAGRQNVMVLQRFNHAKEMVRIYLTWESYPQIAKRPEMPDDRTGFADSYWKAMNEFSHGDALMEIKVSKELSSLSWDSVMKTLNRSWFRLKSEQIVTVYSSSFFLRLFWLNALFRKRVIQHILNALKDILLSKWSLMACLTSHRSTRSTKALLGLGYVYRGLCACNQFLNRMATDADHIRKHRIKQELELYHDKVPEMRPPVRYPWFDDDDDDDEI